LGELHSWSSTSWGLARALKQSHQVDLFATDGIKHLPLDLKPNLIGYTELNQQKISGRLPDNSYDATISYTCIKNFPFYLNHSKKNRIGIWLWEWKNAFPTGFAKHHQSCDVLCAPSYFGKQVFMEAGIPESKIKVIPHGIDRTQFEQTSIINLPTNKKFKIGVVLAQNHLRKNIPGLLEAYGKAFTNKDDVCLVIKAKDKPIVNPFDVSLKECLNIFYKRFPQHAEIKIFSEFIDDMSSFYRSVDAIYSMAHCEGFYLPALEALAAGKINICPNFGGQLDFLNANNALLVDGKETRSNPKSMYWESKNNAVWFEPSTDDAAEKLQHAHKNYQTLNATLDKQKIDVYDAYDWEKIASQFTELCV
jgi:glycosyltransferase involved in cell wall biosynthesis